MTLMQSNLLKALADPTIKTLADAGRKANYSQKSRNIYRTHTKKHIAEKISCNPNAIREKFDFVLEKALETKDFTLYKAILDSMARLNGMLTDRQITEHKEAIPDTIKELFSVRNASIEKSI